MKNQHIDNIGYEIKYAVLGVFTGLVQQTLHQLRIMRRAADAMVLLRTVRKFHAKSDFSSPPPCYKFFNPLPLKHDVNCE